MKTGKFFLAIIFLALISDSCRKDNRDFIFTVKPKDFLASSKYEKLELDVVYVEGYKPTAEAMANVQNFLRDRLNKPSGIRVSYKSIPAQGKSFYSTDDLQKLEKNERSIFTKGKTLATFIFFADAPYTTDNVLGLAYSTTSFVIFESTVQANSGGITQPSTEVLETTIAEHEFGHLIGLVDNGTEMQSDHLDLSNGKHCSNQNCLMFHETETTAILGALTGGAIPALDENCIADLRENGGK